MRPTPTSSPLPRYTFCSRTPPLSICMCTSTCSCTSIRGSNKPYASPPSASSSSPASPSVSPSSPSSSFPSSGSAVAMPSLRHRQICAYLTVRKRGRIILSLSSSTIITRPLDNPVARLARHTRNTHFLTSSKLAHFALSLSSCCPSSPVFLLLAILPFHFSPSFSFPPTCLFLYLCGRIDLLVSVTDTIHSSYFIMYLSIPVHCFCPLPPFSISFCCRIMLPKARAFVPFYYRPLNLSCYFLSLFIFYFLPRSTLSCSLL